jgi:hypothetical protein
MKVLVKGVGEVSLTQREFVAKGGEGSIYARAGVAYKLYEDPSKMIDYGKIQELAVLTHPSIIRPEGLITDPNHVPIGYTMKHLPKTYVLCQLFTKAFKQRNGVNGQIVVDLVKHFREMIEFIHRKNILVVDLNEMNFLCSTDLKNIYAIDVNSYQTPSFPATAIMDSIRDRHAKKFNESTDWFSWAIVTFQMIIGIHPYKGTHPKFEPVALDERLDARMKANVSVFHSESRLPKVCEPFDAIPISLRKWYEAVFEKGLREAPPEDFEKIGPVVVKIKDVGVGKFFEIEKIEDYDAEVIGHYFSFGTRVVVTKSSIYVNKVRHHLPSEKVRIGFSPSGAPIACWLDNGLVNLFDVGSDKAIPYVSHGDAVTTSGDRIYIQNGANFVEVICTEIGGKIIASPKAIGRILDVPEATHVFEGVVFQNLLGRWFATFFPSTGKRIQSKVEELDGYQIVEARHDGRVMVVIGVRKGRYDRFLIRWSSDYTTYSCAVTKNISYTGINFTVGGNGVMVLINEEELVGVASNDPTSAGIKVMTDDQISGDMRLSHEGAKIVFYRGTSLYQIRMK